MKAAARVLGALPGRHWRCGWLSPSLRRARVVRIRVATKATINDIGETTFQTPKGLCFRMTLRLFALIVCTPERMRAHLGQGHDVQGSVELAIAEPRQAVAHDVSARGFQWRHPTVRGKVLPRLNATWPRYGRDGRIWSVRRS